MTKMTRAKHHHLRPVLIQMGMAHWVSHIVYVAAKLGLADHLAKGPMSAEQLAGPTGTHAPSLYRLMRTLASLGIMTEDAKHRFALTPLGDALKTGAPGCARADDPDPGERLVDARVRPAAVFGSNRQARVRETSWACPSSTGWRSNPEEASMFSETMVGFHGAEPPAVAAAYDFSGLKTIVDVGGATGNLLTAILASHPGSRGILYDLPHVVRDAPALIRHAAWRIESRSRREVSSTAFPPAATPICFRTSSTIGAEEQCLTILGNCRRAMNPASRLLIIEMVLPEGNTPHPGKMLDLMMLVGPGGRERTEQEYGTLLGKAGLRLTRVVPTESAVSVVEAKMV